MATPTKSRGPGIGPGSDGKRLAIDVFLKTLDAVDVRRVMRAQMRRTSGRLRFAGSSLTANGSASSDNFISLKTAPVVIAFGKAAGVMAHTLHEILNGEIRSGLVVAPAEPEQRLERFRYVVGGHPYPNAGSRDAAKAAIEMVSGLDRRDAVILLISGGGSALFEEPLDPAVTLSDLVEFNRALVTSGLPIERINVLRKHVSAVKGGRLAQRAFPAQQLTVFVSDVPETLDSMVASGPSWPDDSTVAECYTIADASQLAVKVPDSLRGHFVNRTLEETPKPGDSRFKHSHYWRLLSNRDAVEAARAAAEALGFVAEFAPGPWDADFRAVGRANAAALDLLASRHPGEPVCLVAGGEVSCPVTGTGHGGRNQAFALYATGLIAGRRRVVLSAGTDGRDGNSPAAGAVADGETLARGADLGLDPEEYLAASDSYGFFRLLGDTIETGYTSNNVRDVRLWLDLGS